MKKDRSPEHRLLFSQLEQIARGLGKTFAPFCEVVVHDLTDPQHAVSSIHNNLSGRREGAAATELGLARIADPEFPQVLANYANEFFDGRKAKSTSIGIKDSTGAFVAALCLNIDLSLFQGLKSVLDNFVSLDLDERLSPPENLAPNGAETIRDRIDRFAARRSTTPRAMKADDRRALILELKNSGLLEKRRSMETVAAYLGISRASAYNYLKAVRDKDPFRDGG